MDEWCETKHLRKHWWYSTFQRSPTTDGFSTEPTSLLKSLSLLVVPKVGWDLQGRRFNTRKAMQLVAWFPWWAWKVRGAGSQFDGRQCESSLGALSQGDNDGKWMWWVKVKSTYCILIVQIEVYIHTFNPSSLRYRVDLEELRQGEFHRFCCFCKTFLVLNQFCTDGLRWVYHSSLAWTTSRSWRFVIFWIDVFCFQMWRWWEKEMVETSWWSWTAARRVRILQISPWERVVFLRQKRGELEHVIKYFNHV